MDIVRAQDIPASEKTSILTVISAKVSERAGSLNLQGRLESRETTDGIFARTTASQACDKLLGSIAATLDRETAWPYFALEIPHPDSL